MAGRYSYEIPEVTLFFYNKLLRGCRAIKINASGFNAFASPNFKPLAEIGVNINGNLLNTACAATYNIIFYSETEKCLQTSGSFNDLHQHGF